VGTSAVAPSSGAAGASQSVAGENTIATELDVLLRAPRDVSYLAYRRAEAARILLMADTHSGVSNPDRRYLAELTASVTGVGPTVAETRVNHAITAARTALRKARAAAVLQAFFVGVALLVGAAIAWFAAVEGGKDRESGTFFSWSHHRRWNEKGERAHPQHRQRRWGNCPCHVQQRPLQKPPHRIQRQSPVRTRSIGSFLRDGAP
jgi:hypothetical protein